MSLFTFMIYFHQKKSKAINNKLYHALSMGYFVYEGLEKMESLFGQHISRCSRNLQRIDRFRYFTESNGGRPPMMAA